MMRHSHAGRPPGAPHDIGNFRFHWGLIDRRRLWFVRRRFGSFVGWFVVFFVVILYFPGSPCAHLNVLFRWAGNQTLCQPLS